MKDDTHDQSSNPVSIEICLMRSLKPKNIILLAFFLVITFSMINNTTSISPYFCSNTTMFANGSTYQHNLNILFGNLVSDAINNTSGFHQVMVGNPTIEAVYGQYLCRGDLNTRSCHQCVATAATTDLPKTYCPNRKIAIIWYGECMVRYSDTSFFNTMDQSPYVIWNIINITDNLAQFKEVLGNMMYNVILTRVSEGGPLKKFAVDIAKYSNFESIYGLAQCTPDLSSSDCKQCLISSFGMFKNTQGCQVFTRSCIVQYEIYPFFNQSFVLESSRSTTMPSDSRGSFAKKKLISILVPIFGVIGILLIFGIWIWISMQKRKVLENYSNFTIDEIESIEALQFDLSQIKAATHNFCVDNILGQGGFGVVYKGILDNRQEVALKRLSNNSKQGIQEFKTEVVLLAELRHKNLVKLLGFCLASQEKILVYEYLPNSSLDQFLLDQSKRSLLHWDVRFKIIVGIARGLRYLHEESRLKIIHRDLKSSNILLDDAMNPKIADFGLAKLFEVDQTQGDTKRIIGTYGYMAPEYAMTGHFSVKSDVYSFGVIILEILSGQTNRHFGRPTNEEALLHRAWRLWSEGSPLDLIDKELGNDYPVDEVRKCVHIGLLCVQENAVDRPRITTIVAALDRLSVGLPMLKPPAFLGDQKNTEKFVHYNQLSKIEYNQVALDNGHKSLYSGSSEITNVYPR